MVVNCARDGEGFVQESSGGIITFINLVVRRWLLSQNTDFFVFALVCCCSLIVFGMK